MTLTMCFFHQCKRVIDWLSLPICDSLIGCVWNLLIQKIKIPARFMNVAFAIPPAAITMGQIECLKEYEEDIHSLITINELVTG